MPSKLKPLRTRLFNRANAAWDSGALREAFALFTRAAELGDRGSQLDLGYFYDRGLFVKRDKNNAIKWYRKAYRRGDAGAANNIATIYRELGDTTKMLWWFRRAAAMGDVDVLLDMGRRYEQGKAVPKNFAKARMFYRRVLSRKNASEDDCRTAHDRLRRLNARK